jgi:hypothetical protein
MSPREITIDGVVYIEKPAALDGNSTTHAQRGEVAERFVAVSQGLILAGRPQDVVLRKLQAARNVLTGRVEEAKLPPPKLPADEIQPLGFKRRAPKKRKAKR